MSLHQAILQTTADLRRQKKKHCTKQNHICLGNIRVVTTVLYRTPFKVVNRRKVWTLYVMIHLTHQFTPFWHFRSAKVDLFSSVFLQIIMLRTPQEHDGAWTKKLLQLNIARLVLLIPFRYAQLLVNCSASVTNHVFYFKHYIILLQAKLSAVSAI